ncbi:MAG: hypothetical protein NTW08_03850 [Gammaproteobacteria bacterium]|nr:hypothetical protein [Gammaproteobacteria bacterium]
MNRPTHEEIEHVIQTEAYQACLASLPERIAETIASTHFDLPFFTWLILDYLRRVNQPGLADEEITALEQTVKRKLLSAPIALWHTPIIAKEGAPEYPLIPFTVFFNHLMNARIYNVDLAACLPQITETLIHTYLENLKNTFDGETFRRILCDFSFAFSVNTDNATLNQMFHLLLPHFDNDLLMHDLSRFSNAGNTPFRLLSIGFYRSVSTGVFLEDYVTLFNQIPPKGLSIEVMQGVEPGDTALRVLASAFSKIPDNPRLDTLMLSAIKKAEGAAFGKIALCHEKGPISPISEIANGLAQKPKSAIRILCLHQAVGKLPLESSKGLISVNNESETSMAQFLLNLVFKLYDKPNPMMMIPVRQLIQLYDVEQQETGSEQFFQQILHGLSPEQTLTLMVYLLLEIKEHHEANLPEIKLLCQLGVHLPTDRWESNVRLSTLDEEGLPKKQRKPLETGTLFTLFLQGLSIGLKQNQPILANLLLQLLNHLLEQCIKSEDEAMKEMWESAPLIDGQLSPLHQLAKLVTEHSAPTKLLCKVMMMVPQSALRALAPLWTTASMPPEVKKIYENRCPAPKAKPQPKAALPKKEAQPTPASAASKRLPASLNPSVKQRVEVSKPHLPETKKTKPITAAASFDDTTPSPPPHELTTATNDIERPSELAEARVEIAHATTQTCHQLHDDCLEVSPARLDTAASSTEKGSVGRVESNDDDTTSHRQESPHHQAATNTPPAPLKAPFQPKTRVYPFFNLPRIAVMSSYDALKLVKAICPYNDPNCANILALMNRLNRIHPSFWATQAQINDDKVSPFLYLINRCLYQSAKYKPNSLYYHLISQIAKLITAQEWLTIESWNGNHWTYFTKIVDALYYNRTLDLELIEACEWFVKQNPQDMWTKGLQYNGVEVEFPLRQILGVLGKNPAEPALYPLILLAEYYAPNEAWHQCGVGVPQNSISAYSTLQTLVQTQQLPAQFMEHALAILDKQNLGRSTQHTF